MAAPFLPAPEANSAEYWQSSDDTQLETFGLLERRRVDSPAHGGERRAMSSRLCSAACSPPSCDSCAARAADWALRR